MLLRRAVSMTMGVMLVITMAPVGVTASETPTALEIQTESAEPSADPGASFEGPTKEGYSEKATDEVHGTPIGNESAEEPETAASESEQPVKKSVTAEETGQAYLEVRHQQIADNGSVIFYARLVDAEEADGTWTFVFNGEEVVRKNEKTSAQAKFFGLPDGYQAGESYDVTVRYQGTVDGKPVEEEITYPFILVLLKSEVSCTEKGVAYKAELAGAAKAQGNWTFLLVGEKTQIIQDTGQVTGSVQKHVITADELKDEGVGPGIYDVHVDFQGRANGSKTGLYTVDTLTLEEGTPCLPKSDDPDDEKDPDQGKTPDDGKTERPDSNRETGKQVENNKGANLPQTSTNEFFYMLLGAGMALAGWILFLIRKRFA